MNSLRRTGEPRRPGSGALLLASVAPDQSIKGVQDVEIEEIGIVLVRRDNSGLDVLEDVEVLFLDLHNTSK